MGFSQNLQFFRKQQNITQEQLAEKLEVSRQTVSKWEAGSSYPEMEKILQLCDIFSCSMDLLLRGDAEASLQQENTGYDQQMTRFTKQITWGVALTLIGLCAFLACLCFGIQILLAVSVFLLFLIVSALVFVIAGIQHSFFKRQNPFVLDFYTEEEKRRAAQKFSIQIALGVGISLIGLLLFLLLFYIFPNNNLLPATVFLCFIAAAAPIFVYAGLTNGKYKIESYNANNKREMEIEKRSEENGIKIGAWSSCIMLLATVLFLLFGFLWNAWKIAWIVYPIGALLCGVVAVLYSLIPKKKDL